MGLVGNSTGLGISDLQTGISSQGMREYLEELKITVFDQAKEHLQAVEEIQAALDAAWQGHAKDVFVSQFNGSVEQILLGLDTEYSSLVNMLTNIQSDYFAIDNSLLGEE